MESPLKQWREKQGLTQSDVGYMAGVAQSHITEVEKGRVQLGEKLESFLENKGDEAREVIRLHSLYMEYIKGKLESKIKMG